MLLPSQGKVEVVDLIDGVDREQPAGTQVGRKIVALPLAVGVVKFGGSSRPSRLTVAKAVRLNVTLYVPGRKSTIL
jgi:hypothetical protein